MEIHRIGVDGDVKQIRALISKYDGQVDAIGLDGIPVALHLGDAHLPHRVGGPLPTLARRTPVVDGSGIRASLERWGVILADRSEPGIFSQKHVLMVPGLNHNGLAEALSRRTPHIRYADPMVFFALPDFVPGVGPVSYTHLTLPTKA